MKKRILSAFLCLCMMLTLAPAAFAADADETGGGSTSRDNTQTNADAIITLGNTEGFKMGVTYTPTADGKTLNIVLSGDVDSTNFTDDSVAIKVTFPKEDGEETAKAYSGTLTLNENKTGVTFKADNGQTLGSYETVDVNVDGIKVISGNTDPDPDPNPDPDPAPTQVNALTVSVAPLEDTRTEGKLDVLYKADSYRIVEGEAQGTDEAYTQSIKIFAEGLKEHQNGDTTPAMGYWVGFFVKAPENATSVTYSKDENPTQTTPLENVNGEQGLAFYIDAAKEKTATRSVEFTIDDGATARTTSTVKAVYTVDLNGVECEGEAAEDSVSFHFADPYRDIAINARIDGKVIKLSGDVNASMFAEADDNKVAGKLEYTIGAVNQTYAILMSLKDGKLTYEKDPSGGSAEALPEGYTLDISEIVVKAADVPENVETKAPVVADSEGIDDPTDATAAKEIAGTVAAADTEMNKIVSDNDALNKVAADAEEAGHTVEVFIEVKATGYEKDDNGNVASVKLDITPKYQVKDGSTNVGTAQEFEVKKPITLTVTLPSSFANALNVFAKHLDASGNEKDRYKVTMNGTTGTFTTDGFSEFEFTKDERTVTVAYHGISAEETSYFEVEYRTPMIDNARLIKGDGSDYTLDAHEGTFKGWSTKENDTNVEYEAGALLTTTIFDKLYNAATNGVEHLYPVFVKEGSSGGNTGSSGSGGGGGSKRPDSSNNNNNTTTPTTPSDYGNNPSTPSTPSTPASSTGFSDVVAGGWYESAVQYMKDNGLMAGTSATTFAPDATTTRGMIVTILYRLEKEPEAAASTFSDIAAGEWYSNAVAWAAANNIVSGYENGTFGANDVITREQMAAILFRYASFKGYDVTKTADISSFADAAQVSAYAADAMKWANAAGLISGTSATTLAPTGSATRAQAASILMRFCENVAK